MLAEYGGVVPTWDGLYFGTNGTSDEISGKAVSSVGTNWTAVLSVGTTAGFFPVRFLFYSSMSIVSLCW